MNDVARTTLQQILDRAGHEVLDTPERVEGLLRDRCGECRLEISLLTSSLRAGVPRALLRQQPTPSVRATLVRRLMDEVGLMETSSAWAVDSWASALGMPFAVPADAGPAAAEPGRPDPIGDAPTPALPDLRPRPPAEAQRDPLSEVWSEPIDGPTGGPAREVWPDPAALARPAPQAPYAASYVVPAALAAARAGARAVPSPSAATRPGLPFRLTDAQTIAVAAALNVLGAVIGLMVVLRSSSQTGAAGGMFALLATAGVGFLSWKMLTDRSRWAVITLLAWDAIVTLGGLAQGVNLGTFYSILVVFLTYRAARAIFAPAAGEPAGPLGPPAPAAAPRAGGAPPYPAAPAPPAPPEG